MSEVRKIRMETVRTPGISETAIIVGGTLFFLFISAFFFVLPNNAQPHGISNRAFDMLGIIFAAGAPLLLLLCAWIKHCERKLRDLNDRQRQENRAAGLTIGHVTALK